MLSERPTTELQENEDWVTTVLLSFSLLGLFKNHIITHFRKIQKHRSVFLKNLS
jgi:hypothetical protein